MLVDAVFVGDPLALRDQFTAGTLLAAQVFLAVRVVYVPVYAFGVPVLRTFLWLAGFAATVLLYLMGL